MHDGTIAQGDTWLQNNMSGYINWAQTHNSVFVVTWDEDDYTEANQIPTVITGQRVAAGSYPEQVNHYNLLRTIEDGYGLPGIGAAATATPLLDIWTPPSGDQPPVAEFTTDCTGAVCNFDATPSADPDGSITSYSWSFGDATTGSGQTTSHTYGYGGAKSVTLTVADNQGATATVTHTANPVAPVASPFVVDTFNRTVRNGWGTADTGGTWSTSGTTANFTVDPGKGAMSLSKAGINLSSWVGPAVTDADVSPVFSVGKVPIGGSVYATVDGRRIDAKNYYGATVFINADGSVTLNLNRTVAGTGTVLTSIKVAGLTVTAGMSLQARLQVTGTSPTTLRARVWASSAPEPTTWRLTATDSSAALQAAGQTGLVAYLASGVTNAPFPLTFTGFTARPTNAGTNQSPTAAFTSSCTQLSCSFDATSSSDPDGTIANYSWTFGDGATGTGATPAHAYVTANDYVVTLTVTDNMGAPATVSHTVTASNPPANQPPTARFTSSCTALACSFDGSGSSDPEDGVVATYSWAFGDPADPTGATIAAPSHTYATGGTYTVTLTVTDSAGAPASVSHTVTVSSGSTPFVSDSFSRTVSNGWGTADTGGSWSTVGNVARFAVASGAASMTFPSPGIQLETFVGPSRTDADVVTDVALDKVPVGAPVYISLTGRRVSAGNTYVGKVQVYPTGQVTLRLNRLVAGSEAVLAGPITVPGLTYTAGMRISMRVQVTGTSPTTVRARAWDAAASEPATWQVSATDSSAALQQPGTVGTVVYVPSAITNAPIRVSYTRFVAAPPG